VVAQVPHLDGLVDAQREHVVQGVIQRNAAHAAGVAAQVANLAASGALRQLTTGTAA
jgi:hypothetical protein